ncbi:hypothetical protein ANCCAN_17174 [Ancylostoma caninum]|uniref:Uncharacterized protein n=1 Tax=Ancylostoma caninum TaxID=29170 RepID=A0A368FXL6_ANCCA|nr:hypothetical protein ANCCAN_17174 [Ancylostoma caninum]
MFCFQFRSVSGNFRGVSRFSFVVWIDLRRFPCRFAISKRF